jgi:hypothetical protein
VALYRQGKKRRFPSDIEFREALETRDVYDMRTCFYLLDRLENFSKERIDTSNFSIEHVMPQNEDLRPEWREMLGSDWKAVQETWLHRLSDLPGIFRIAGECPSTGYLIACTVTGLSTPERNSFDASVRSSNPNPTRVELTGSVANPFSEIWRIEIDTLSAHAFCSGGVVSLSTVPKKSACPGAALRTEACTAAGEVAAGCS